MSIPLHITDIALLKTLDEDDATRWTLADIKTLFRTRTTFEESLQRLQQREFLHAWQERGPFRRLRWAFAFIPSKRAEARLVITGADQVALADQLIVLGRLAPLTSECTR